MGNLFVKKKTTVDDIILNKLNQPLIPDIQRQIFERLIQLENEVDELKQQENTNKQTLDALLHTLSQHKVRTNDYFYKLSECINMLKRDGKTLLNNDIVLNNKLDQLKKINNVEGLYTQSVFDSTLDSVAPNTLKIYQDDEEKETNIDSLLLESDSIKIYN